MHNPGGNRVARWPELADDCISRRTMGSAFLILPQRVTATKQLPPQKLEMTLRKVKIRSKCCIYPVDVTGWRSIRIGWQRIVCRREPHAHDSPPTKAAFDAGASASATPPSHGRLPTEKGTKNASPIVLIRWVAFNIFTPLAHERGGGGGGETKSRHRGSEMRKILDRNICRQVAGDGRVPQTVRVACYM